MIYTEPRHPINFVSRRTGLSTHLIRAWETRYGAITPERTDTNRRLYSDADIDRLKTLSRLTGLGHTIGQIARLDKARLDSMVRDSLPDESTPIGNAATSDGTASREILRRCQTAIAGLDSESLHVALMDANVRLAQPVLFREVIGPLLTWIGDEWHKGSLRVMHEHLATGVLRDFFAELCRMNRPRTGAQNVVVSTPSGELHEFGALMASASAAADGWRDVYLGPNTPWQEIAGAVLGSKARAVALSLSYPGDDPTVYDELESLRRYLPESIPIIVGGTGAAGQRSHLEDLGLTVAGSFDEFRAALSALRE